VNLENDGERMDIDFYRMDYGSFDACKKTHYRRYEFASSQLDGEDVVGDMACGSGYGSVMMSRKCRKVRGYDIDGKTVEEVARRYRGENVEFEAKNLLDIDESGVYDKIMSFETIEHFSPEESPLLLKKFHMALKDDGRLVFSMPYDQKRCPYSVRYHKTFEIKEDTLAAMLLGLFEVEKLYYQDYETHILKGDEGKKDFIVCVARKIVKRSPL
jgi:2-polyprenyl-3-methyl-5-hydroxy-6-metoxy-1,4-benzoquinol methylase